MYNLYRQCTADHYPYTIQRDDTLNSIASRLEVNVTRIIAANPGVDPHNLRIGQVICIPACQANHTSYIIKAGDMLYRIAQAYNVSVESIIRVNPSVDPNYLRVGQRICIPVTTPDNCEEIIGAMQRDIDMLKAESSVQKTHESNYGTSTQTTRALVVSDRELQFDTVPIFFSGNYKGRYTVGKSYPYYADAAMGGRRGITVKDNFGIWHSFNYRLPMVP